MANAMYQNGLKHFARGDILWLAAGGSAIKAIMARSSAYTPNLTTDEFFSDITGGGIGNNGNTRRPGAVHLVLTDATGGGVCAAQNIKFSSVPTGVAIQYLIVFKDTGADGTSPLLCFYDTGANLPVTPNNGDITISWDPGPNKVFA